MFVQAGLTPGEALKTDTYNPAKFLGMLDRLGTIEKGKLADLVLLDANPLDDITNTQKIRAVLLNGKYFDRTALDRLLADAVSVASTNSERSTRGSECNGDVSPIDLDKQVVSLPFIGSNAVNTSRF